MVCDGVMSSVQIWLQRRKNSSGKVQLTTSRNARYVAAARQDQCMSQAVHRLTILARMVQAPMFGPCPAWTRTLSVVYRVSSNVNSINFGNAGWLVPSCIARHPFGTLRMSLGWKIDIFSVRVGYEPLRCNHGRTGSTVMFPIYDQRHLLHSLAPNPEKPEPNS